MTNNLEKRILEKIKKENIEPISKSYFVIKNSFFISLFIMSIILGSISFSVLFYIFSHNQNILFDSYNIYQLKNAIIFWAVLLLIFLILSIKNISFIKNSYRYTPTLLALLNIIISLIFGLVLFYSGVGEKTDIYSSSKLNFYQKNIHITEIKKDIFLNKIKNIGITKEILESHPRLKKQMQNKFNELVLGKKIIDTSRTCNIESFLCKEDEIFFKKKEGCGCLKVYR